MPVADSRWSTAGSGGPLSEGAPQMLIRRPIRLQDDFFVARLPDSARWEPYPVILAAHHWRRVFSEPGSSKPLCERAELEVVDQDFPPAVSALPGFFCPRFIRHIEGEPRLLAVRPRK